MTAPEAVPILAVLSAAGLLDDDRVPAILSWFEGQLAGLPLSMTDELRGWFRVLHEGSPVPPRSRPRAVVTIRLRVLWASL